MTKKYRIDFKNGKVFEAVKDRFGYFVGPKELYYTEEVFEYVGATITEIEEPRRSFWIQVENQKYIVLHSKECLGPKGPFWHVVAINKGEVIVSREKLAEAYKKYELGAWKGDTDTSYFQGFCKELGLGE